MKEFYRLRFDGPIEWEHVVEHDNGVVESTLHLSDAARQALTIGGRAACGIFGHDDYTIPGLKRTVCLRCSEVL